MLVGSFAFAAYFSRSAESNILGVCFHAFTRFYFFRDKQKRFGELDLVALLIGDSEEI